MQNYSNTDNTKFEVNFQSNNDHSSILKKSSNKPISNNIFDDIEPGNTDEKLWMKTINKTSSLPPFQILNLIYIYILFNLTF